MGDRLEDRIRDYLANRLNLVENGLTLVDTEYTLRSTAGAGGRIDIVARDMFGNVVVIEIKRSDQAARQAVHEFCKYTALFRIDQGIGEGRLRLIVLSTDWHELLLPFSEFARSTNYPVEGFEIRADADGAITECTKKQLAPTGSPVQISRMQGLYLFSDVHSRNGFFETISKIAAGCGINDLIVLKCDYAGSNDAVMYPYGAYLCFSSPMGGLQTDAASKLKAQIGWDDDLDEPDENFLVAVNEHPECRPHTFEIGYPEKLTNMAAVGWDLSVAIRAGRLGNSVFTDSELLRLARFVEGRSPIYLQKITSPRFAVAWRQLRTDVANVLRGNKNWQDTVPQLLAEVERSTPDANVAIRLYVPANLPIALFHLALDENLEYFPTLEVMVEDPQSKRVRVIYGTLVWSGEPPASVFRDIITKTFGGISQWTMALHFHAEYEHDDELILAHNLRSVVIERVPTKDAELEPMEVVAAGETLVRRPLAPPPVKSIAELGHDNQEYLRNLVLEVRTAIGGLQDNETDQVTEYE